jgi:hypothetical protein
MGFEGRKVLKLKFEDSDLDGLEVVTRYPTIEQVMAVQDEQEALGEDAAPLDVLRVIAELLCDVLVSWNLENDGTEVLHTADALLAQDYDLVQAIVSAWEENTFKVARPLPDGSSAGEPFQEASIPMVALLPSQAS